MKDFLKSFFGSLAAMAIVAGGFFFVLLILLIAAAGEDLPSVPSKAVLVLDLSTPISDRPYVEDPEVILQQALTGSKPTETVALRTVLEAIESARDDDRIRAIFIKGPLSSPGYKSGWAALKEVREELERFKESGKEILAYSLVYGERDYYLASVADSIKLHPLGLLEFNGLASQQMFFAGALRKFGVDMQVIRVGKYKAAVEPYMREDLSEAAREQTAKLLEDIYNPFLEAVSAAREIEVARLREIADELVLLKPSEAVECRLADEATHFDTVRSHFQELTETSDSKDFAKISIQDYAKATGGARSGSGGEVAVVYAEGEIVDGTSRTEVGGDSLAKLLRQARDDDNVKAVVLRVNSPGGSASASEVIQRETRLIRDAGKPFVVSMGTVAASGGYWISAYADEIVAQPNTITGSIGVFNVIPNAKKLANDFGITFDTVLTNKHADMVNLMRPLDEREREIIQGLVDEIYESFLAKVSEGRNLDKQAVHEIGQGRVWSGVEAHKLGLVDTLGSLEDAIASAAEKADLGDDYRLRFYQKRKDFGEALLEMLENGEEVRSKGLLESEIDRLGSLLTRLRNLNDPNGLYLRMEFDFNIR